MIKIFKRLVSKSTIDWQKKKNSAGRYTNSKKMLWHKREKWYYNINSLIFLIIKKIEDRRGVIFEKKKFFFFWWKKKKNKWRGNRSLTAFWLVKTCRKIWWFWKPSHFRKTFWGGNQCGSQEEDGAHGGGGKQGVVPNARRKFSKVKVESEEEA